jgi:hypothetical protein
MSSLDAPRRSDEPAIQASVDAGLAGGERDEELPADPPVVAALAAEQGVRPIEDIEELGGDFWPEDESTEELLATLRAWREDETASTRSEWPA